MNTIKDGKNGTDGKNGRGWRAWAMAGLACLGLSAGTTWAASYHSTPGIYVDGSTNTITVATVTNVPVATVTGTNVYFNMPGLTSTNLWPAVELDDPRSQDNFQHLLVGWQYKLSAAGNYTNTFILAVSPDSSHWISNYFTITQTASYSAGAVTTLLTNLDLGGIRFVALQEIDCVSTNSGSMTNLLLYPPIEKNSL